VNLEVFPFQTMTMAMQQLVGQQRIFVNLVDVAPGAGSHLQSAVMMPLLAQPAPPIAEDSEMPKKQKLPPHVQDQFHKTRICNFFQQGRCTWGTTCRFAHHEDELGTAPDLTKTKLCFNFFRRRCNDAECCFAHGHQELRATTGVYKTELCRWYETGDCKAGSACRYAHGLDELRPSVVSSLLTQLPEEQIAEENAVIEAAKERSLSDFSDRLSDGPVLCVRGTFLEIATDEKEAPLMRRLRRSWSDGDIAGSSDAGSGSDPTTAPEDGSIADSTDSEFEATARILPAGPPGSWCQAPAGPPGEWGQASDAVIEDVSPEDHIPVVSTSPTTLALRNIPKSYTRTMLLDLLDEDFAGQYDFVYLPSDFKCLAVYGYAFVNFTSHEVAEEVREQLDGFCEWMVPHNKCLDVSWSEVQGPEAHIDRYRNSPVMHDSVPDDARPALFESGQRVPFPLPTRRIRLPRTRRAPMAKDSDYE